MNRARQRGVHEEGALDRQETLRRCCIQRYAVQVDDVSIGDFEAENEVRIRGRGDPTHLTVVVADSVDRWRSTGRWARGPVVDRECDPRRTAGDFRSMNLD